MEQLIDLRSDTVSKPTDAMRQAMATAEVGDDVFGDDPTVLALEAATAELLNKEAAVFVASGTQSNLCGLLAHCQRGDEYIVGDHAHTYWYEAGGAAVLGSIQPQPVRMLESGMLDLDHVRQVIKPDDHHFARSRLLCLENTHDGKPVSLADQDRAAALASDAGLALHLDGARLWNAAVALDATPAQLAEPFATVSVCLSKGLGAPMGSVLVGSTELIAEARKWRKMLGGGMRQVGIVAAAGLYALDHHRDRLANDHANAARLVSGLADIAWLDVTGHATNMVFLEFDANAGQLEEEMKQQGIVLRTYPGPERNGTRMVLHLGVSAADVEHVISSLQSFVPQ